MPSFCIGPPKKEFLNFRLLRVRASSSYPLSMSKEGSEEGNQPVESKVWNSTAFGLRQVRTWKAVESIVGSSVNNVSDVKSELESELELESERSLS